MTDKMTAEQALEMLSDMAHMEDEEYAKAGGGGRVESLHAIIRQALTAPRVPEEWLVMRGKYGIIVQGPEGMITEQVRSSKQNLCFHDPVIYQFLESVLTTAPAPADSDPMPMPLFTTMEGEEIKRLRERVKLLEDAISQHNAEMDSMCDDKSHCGYAQYNRNCPNCPADYKIELATGILLAANKETSHD